MNRKIILSWLVIAAMALQFTGCSSSENTELAEIPEVTEVTAQTEDAQQPAETDQQSETAPSETTAGEKMVSEMSVVNYSEKDLQYEWDKDCTVITAADEKFDIKGSGASSDGSTLTIASEGTYYISGNMPDGKIIIDTQDTKAVRLVMGGLNISCSDDVPINVKAADKLIITLENNKENSVSGTVSGDDDAPSGVIFSKSDLTVNGGGKLSVSAAGGDGIVSKDKLKIVSGEINVISEDDGISGRDMLAVRDGKIKISSKGDGMKSTNAEKGDVVVEGGSIEISSENDGIQSESTFSVYGGEIKILSGGGSDNGKEHHDNMGFGRGFGQNQSFEEDNSDTVSMKGIKAKSDISVNGGDISVNSADDAFHSDTLIDISEGNINLMTGDDGIHSEGEVNISGGSVRIGKSYEGIEGSLIKVNGGTIHLNSDDDGFNVSSSDRNAELLLDISGGFIYVNAAGDGLDSNGNIVMTGGTVLVNGPESNNNGPLDCGDNNNDIRISGGVLIAAGSSGMFETPSEQSEQNSVVSSMINAEAGTLCTLADESGNVIAAFRTAKNAQAIVISSPEIRTGSVYKLCTGAEYSGELSEEGYAEGGTTEGGTEIASFDISSPLTVHGNISRGGFGGGRKQFENGGDQFQMPEGGFGNGMNGRKPKFGEDFDPSQMPEGFEMPEGFGNRERTGTPEKFGHGDGQPPQMQ